METNTISKANNYTIRDRVIRCIKEVFKPTLKTCIWLIKITVFVSFIILILKYLNILPWFSELITPIFNHLGLPGEAALPYVTGYFVNVYAAISVAIAFDFDIRALTILSTMILCSHNMVTETAVQKKTGSSAIRIVIIRTISAFALAYILNLILPGSVSSSMSGANIDSKSFAVLLQDWAISTLKIVIKMTVLIFALTIVQRILAEFGVIRWISRFLKPVMKFFGLAPKTSFFWIVANTLGLAYGAAVMIDESNSGKVSEKDINLLNTHISISHSNFEDLFLLSAIGATWYVLLFSRWIMSFILVWELKLEYYLKEKFIQKKL